MECSIEQGVWLKEELWEEKVEVLFVELELELELELQSEEGRV